MMQPDARGTMFHQRRKQAWLQQIGKISGLPGGEHIQLVKATLNKAQKGPVLCGILLGLSSGVCNNNIKIALLLKGNSLCFLLKTEAM